MTLAAVTPRSFRQVPGRHQEELAASGLDVRYPTVDRHLTEAEMIELVAGCSGLITGIDPVTAAVMDAGPLRVVAKYGSGLDNIDLDAAEERGIPVTATPGQNSQAVAELTLALAFALARSVVFHDRSARESEWRRRIGVELSSKQLGLIGLGEVGRRVSRMARGVGMEVVATDPFVTSAEVPMVDFDKLVRTSDVVSLHAPLGPATSGMVDSAFLASMRQGALLINTARGGLVDLEAVALSLDARHLGGFASDDFESPPDGASVLWRLPNVIFSPHAGASTVEAVERTGLAAVAALVEGLSELSNGG